ncbi:Putative GATA-binding transcription factor [Rhizopus microsporus]|nr:Putative GATA-binding transcription factor [Rhizopus microsporus]
MTDIIMYPATSRTLLAFFHDCHQETCYDCKEFHYNMNEMKQSIENYMTPTFLDHLFRVFQIYDNSTHQLLASWPLPLDHSKSIIQTPDKIHHPLYSQEVQRQFIEDVSRLTQKMTIKEINSGHLLQPRLGCSQHIFSNSTVTLDPLGLCDVESITIYFGPIVFATFQITPVHSQSYHRPTSIQSKFRRMPRIHELLNDQTLLIPPKVSKVNDNILQQQLMSSYDSIGANNDSDINDRSNINMDSSSSSSISNSKDNNNHDRLSSFKTWKGKFTVREKKCEHCQVSTSPEWRKGPSGHKTLCNACGLRYARLVAKYEKQQHVSNNDELVRLSSPQKKKKL